jgi:hypothetical protein
MIQELQYVSRYFLLEPSNDMPIIIKQKKEFVSILKISQLVMLGSFNSSNNYDDFLSIISYVISVSVGTLLNALTSTETY